jgi:hypothetical protein
MRTLRPQCLAIHFFGNTIRVFYKIRFYTNIVFCNIRLFSIFVFYIIHYGEIISTIHEEN